MADDQEQTPRWVKVAVAMTLVIVASAIVVIALGGGSHGPQRHAPGADTTRGHTGPPAGATHP